MAPLVLSGLIGAIIFECSVGFSVVEFSFIGWLYEGFDLSTNLSSWLMFRNEPWTIPPGAVHSFGYPVGTSVALTDSIPIAAMFFKALNPILPEDFQYFGLWLLSCFVLQALFGALLMRTVTSSWSLQVLGATLFTLSPILVHRLGHTALCAHWLLLAALWLHVTRGARGQGWRALAPSMVLVGLAAGTHAYLAAMVVAVTAATIVSTSTSLRRVVSTVIVPALAVILTLLSMWWASGYFILGGSSDLQTTGFGRLSMNLLAPFSPLRGMAFADRMPFSLVSSEQLEGFAYFGLGVLFLLPVAVVTATRKGWQWSWTELPLILVCVLLTLLALSPTVTLGTTTLFTYDETLWGPLSMFRASGRMFWPVYYGIVFVALAVVAGRLSRQWAIAVLIAAVAIQAADMNGGFRFTRQATVEPFDEPLPSEFWAVVPAFYRHFVVYPTNMCTPLDQAIDYRFLARRASQAGATINAGNAMRFSAEAVQAYCQTLTEDMMAGRVSDDTLYVLRSGDMGSLSRAQAPMTCAEVDGFSVCFTKRSHERWRNQFGIVPLDRSPVPR